VTKPEKVQILAFYSDSVKRGDCKPSELLNRLDAVLGFTKSTGIVLAEADAGLGGGVIYNAPSVESLNFLKSIEDIVVKSGKVKRINFERFTISGEPKLSQQTLSVRPRSTKVEEVRALLN
jgi:hypothetical protein